MSVSGRLSRLFGGGGGGGGPLRIAHAGLCGKIPAEGDFVARGLPAAERERLERFLAALVTDMAKRDGFDRGWQVMPIARFAARPGGLCSAAALGVILPSVDRVGRRFPLCLALLAEPGADADPEALLTAAAPVLAGLEASGLALLGIGARGPLPPKELPASAPAGRDGPMLALRTGGAAGELLRFSAAPTGGDISDAARALLRGALAVAETEAGAAPTTAPAADPGALFSAGPAPDASLPPMAVQSPAPTAAPEDLPDAPEAAPEAPLFPDTPADPTPEDPLFPDTPADPAPEDPLFPDAPADPAPEAPLFPDAPADAALEKPLFPEAPDPAAALDAEPPAAEDDSKPIPDPAGPASDETSDDDHGGRP